VVSESTRRLLGQTFELTALGPQTLRGFDAPVAAWLIAGGARECQPLRGLAFGDPDAFRRP